jgi:hypothetical protein
VCDAIAGVAQDLGEALRDAGLVVGYENRVAHVRAQSYWNAGLLAKLRDAPRRGGSGRREAVP